MAQKLHIDIETYSSIDITKSGVYKYVESLDFEILLVAYAFDNGEICLIDLANGQQLPQDFLEALQNGSIEKHAHNANFERQAFIQIGYDIPVDQWHCSMVKAAYCGWPLSLGDCSKAMHLEAEGKLTTGRALIKFFCSPIKPTKKNGMRERNLPEHDLDKWAEFGRYCINDVKAERAITNRLKEYKIGVTERLNYLLDQQINDRGILIDPVMVKHAISMDTINAKNIVTTVSKLTNIDNPNSPAQLKAWLTQALNEKVTTLSKDAMPALLEKARGGAAEDVLKARVKLAKTSVKKYTAMINCARSDNRVRGLFQYYGANRTGRWAGRLVQLQNLPQNHIKELDLARQVVASGDYDLTSLLYDDLGSLLSQLVRTAFIAKPGHTFAVADFSAIEARVIAWLAGEKWRLDVFNTHGKIYEASAAMMFNVPLEEVTKGSDLRTKGKIAELALGYQGALGALRKMGGERMGLLDSEMRLIVKRWRLKNLQIVQLWKDVEKFAIQAVKTKKRILFRCLEFEYDGQALQIKLPSGRSLFYQKPKFGVNQFGSEAIQYMGMIQTTRQWDYIDSYGGKFVENIVQAIARDLLADSMLRLDKNGFNIVMHVHDEAICEVPIDDAKDDLNIMCAIMGEPIHWAPGLPLVADGYLTKFYKKD